MKIERIDPPVAATPVRKARWRPASSGSSSILALVARWRASTVYAPQYLPSALARREPRPRGADAAATSADAPVPVLASAATRENVPVYFDGVGSSRALNTVTVRAQVDGKLIA